MILRPYHAWLFLAALLAVPAWRLYQRPKGEFAATAARAERWEALARATPEELDRGATHRYRALAPELAGVRDVGYFSEKTQADLWASSSTPAGHDRIERYYAAQATLAPALLRFDEVRPRVVVDCATPEQAGQVLAREGLTALRDYGRGLVLARPGS